MVLDSSHHVWWLKRNIGVLCLFTGKSTGHFKAKDLSICTCSHACTHIFKKGETSNLVKQSKARYLRAYFSPEIKCSLTWQAGRASHARGTAATEMLLNTSLCSSTKKSSPTGFLIQCVTSLQRVLKVFRQRSSSLNSGPMTWAAEAGARQLAPWGNYRALVSLQGSTSAAGRKKPLHHYSYPASIPSQSATSEGFFVVVTEQSEIIPTLYQCLVLYCRSHASVCLSTKWVQFSAQDLVTCAWRLRANSVGQSLWIEKKMTWMISTDHSVPGQNRFSG